MNRSPSNVATGKANTWHRRKSYHLLKMDKQKYGGDKQITNRYAAKRWIFIIIFDIVFDRPSKMAVMKDAKTEFCQIPDESAIVNKNPMGFYRLIDVAQLKLFNVSTFGKFYCS